MNPPARTRRRTINALFSVALLLVITPCVSSDDEDSSGWFSGYVEPAESWKEQQGELPVYPVKSNLLDVNISTGGQPYKLYIDTHSIRPGDDSVVRYTVVMISSTGVWNVTNEGLHCGEKMYRRYAYGYEGEWRDLGDSPWKPVSGLGVNQYRRLFYNEYMCNQTEANSTAREIIRKFRSSDFDNE